MSDVLARRDRALTPDETEQLLRDRLGAGIERSVLEFGVFTIWIDQDHWLEAARTCREEPLLAYDMFDNLFAVDVRDDGFDVVAVLYSTSTGNRIALRTRCAGGRDEPVCPSITEIYRGADWMERETWDMFGIDFPGHPSVGPRILTVENFEGWPLRKDFHLASRAAKPWPGVKEPAELDEDGNVIERVPRIGDAPGPYDLDKAMAEQAQVVNPMPEPEQVVVDVADADDDAAQVTAGGDEDPTVSAATKADDRRKAQAEARAKKAAERADGEGKQGSDSGEAAQGLDQEVYDALIAEGKSERVARSKAKAALIKKQRAAEREQDTAEGADTEAADSEATDADGADADGADTEAADSEGADTEAAGDGGDAPKGDA